MAPYIRLISSAVLAIALLMGSLPQGARVAADPVPTFHYPKSPQLPTELYVVHSSDLTTAEFSAIASLQGLLAKTKPEIYMVVDAIPAYAAWLEDLEQHYGVTTVLVTNDGGKRAAAKLIEHYKTRFANYIVYDATTGRPNINDSHNVANSLAGLKEAIMVEKNYEAAFLAYDWGTTLPVKVADVSDKTMAWLVDQPEYDLLRKDMLIELETHEAYEGVFRDYAIMTNSLVFYDSGGPNTPLRQQVLDDLEPDSPVLGWGNFYAGENTFIEPTTRAGHYYIAANWCFNMTVLSAYSLPIVTQKNHDPAPPPITPAKRHVTLLMSDGDNLQYAYGGFRLQGKLYDDPARGTVPLAWGIPASMIDLAPTALKHIYDQASDGTAVGRPAKDQFVFMSAGGYMYPSMFPAHLLADHAAKVNDQLARSDVGIMGIIDLGQYNELSKPMWDTFTAQSNLDGIFYVDYSGYKTATDGILWSNNKPIVASRATFYEGLPDADVAGIANFLRSTPADPSDPASYSLITVHVWTKSVGDVVDLVEQLQNPASPNYVPDVEIVTPQTFVELIKQNVTPAPLNSYVETKQYESVKAIAPITIDGVATAQEWADATEIVVSPNAPDVISHGTVWGEVASLATRYRMRWDAQNLYLLEERTADSFLFEETGELMFLSDATLLYLDLKHDKREGPLKDGDYTLFMTPSGPDEQPHMFIREGHDDGVIERKFTDGQIAGIVTDTSYTMEVAIPWSALQVMPFAPEVGSQIGMSMIATHNDEHGNWGQVMWVGDGDNQARWANLKFVEPPVPVTPVTPVPPVTPVDPVDEEEEPEPVAPEASASAYKPVGAEQLSKQPAYRPVKIELGHSDRGVQLPGNAGQLLKNPRLELSREEASVAIKGSALRAITAELKVDSADGAQQLWLTAGALAEEDAQRLVLQASGAEAAKLALQSAVIELGAAADEEGKDAIQRFPEPLTVSIVPTHASAAPGPVHLYRVLDGGKLMYVPSKLAGGVVKAEVYEPGRYALIRYDKAYSNVPANHWAYHAIHELSARKAIEESETGLFELNGEITRAAFVAMLAQGLGLQPVADPGFSDVAADSPYASYIGAARQAGWVRGDAAGLFNPGQRITREQLAVIMARSLADVQGLGQLVGQSPSQSASQSPSQSAAPFKDDSAISHWARDAVRMTASLGVLNGKPSGRFAPLDHATRAEAAQAVSNLLAYVEHQQ